MIIDPFVASHQVPENDNNAIAAVAAKWGRSPTRARCAVMLVHHVRKTQPGAELSLEDMRGASALLAAVRSGRVINRMPAEFAKRLGIVNPGSYLRIIGASEKGNMVIARSSDDWFELVSVDLQNGVDAGRRWRPDSGRPGRRDHQVEATEHVGWGRCRSREEGAGADR